MSVGRLVVDFIANTLGFETDTKRASKNAEKAAKDIQRSFSRMSSSVTRAFAGIGVGLSFAAIIKNSADAERQLAQLTATIKSTGGAAGFTADQLVEQANALERVGVTSGGDIQRGMARLLTYTEITGERFKEATQAALDMSTALGIDMTSAAETVGKALNYPTQALGSLSKQGFIFTDAQKKLIKSLEDSGRLAEAQGIILDELKNSYAGSARAARDTLGGALQGLKNTVESLLTTKEGIPGITQAVNAFADALASPTLKGAFDSVIGGGLKVLADAILGTIASFQKLGNAIGASAAAAVQAAKLNFTEAGEIWRQATADNIKIESEYQALREKLWSDSGDRIVANAKVTAEQVQSVTKSLGGVREIAVSVSRIGDLSPMQKFYKELDDLTKTSTENQIEAYNQQLAALNFLYDQGLLSAQKYNDRLTEIQSDTLGLNEVEITVKRVNEVFKKTSDELTEFQKQAARNTQDIIADTLVNGFDKGAKGILDSFADMITKLAAQAVAADIAGKLFGSAGGGTGGGWVGTAASWIGSIFGGGRAAGGPVTAGTVYRVNEREPEFFRPRGNGDVIPLSKMPSFGSGGTRVNQTIQVAGRVDQRTARQIQLEALRAQRTANARLG